MRPVIKWMGHHFSHNGAPPREELEAYLSARGMHSTYDGMTVQL